MWTPGFLTDLKAEMPLGLKKEEVECASPGNPEKILSLFYFTF